MTEHVALAADHAGLPLNTESSPPPRNAAANETPGLAMRKSSGPRGQISINPVEEVQRRGLI